MSCVSCLKNQVKAWLAETLRVDPPAEPARPRLIAHQEFSAFATHLRVEHPIKGAIPFVPYDFQLETVGAYEAHRKVVLFGSRQMGLVTTTMAYLLWKALRHADFRILVVAYSHDWARAMAERFRYFWDHIELTVPQVRTSHYTQDRIEFTNGSVVQFRVASPRVTDGAAYDLVYGDEVAHWPAEVADDTLASLYIQMSTGTRVILASTTGGTEHGPFHRVWTAASDSVMPDGSPHRAGEGRNGFYALAIPYSRHPERDAAWAADMEQRLGREQFLVEYGCMFEGDDDREPRSQ